MIIFSSLWIRECRNYCSLAERSSLKSSCPFFDRLFIPLINDAKTNAPCREVLLLVILSSLWSSLWITECRNYCSLQRGSSFSHLVPFVIIFSSLWITECRNYCSLQRGPSFSHLVLSIIIFSSLWITVCRNYCSLQRGPSFSHLVLFMIIFSSLWITECRILMQSCWEVGWKMLFLVAVDKRSLDQLAFFRLMYSTLLNLSNWCGEGARVSNCKLACPPYNHIVLLVLSMFILSFSD